MWQKRGQIYLIAGVIIIGLILSFAVISNYSERRGFTKIYDFRDELEIESERVLDYGAYNQLTENEKINLVADFAGVCKDYEEKQNLYFIFGDQEKINVIKYQESSAEDVFVNINDIDYELTAEDGIPQEFLNPGSNVIIKVRDGEEYNYGFKLKAGGENLYFIISQEIGGERHTATG